jgi:beta-phosphoglucomutase-like phosphatase (HAD superfamily)
MSWIDQVVSRLPWKTQLTNIVSLNEHRELRAKPAPDGYTYLVRMLHATPESSVALEDSSPGIASATAAGLFTIGYREHLPHGYRQTGADAVADHMYGVVSLLESKK